MNALPATVCTQSELVDQDAIDIGELYEKAGSSLVASVKQQAECGRRLTEKKASMKHGEWLPWLEHNAAVLGFTTPQTSGRLMRLAANCTLAHNMSPVEALEASRKTWGHKEAVASAKALQRAADEKRLLGVEPRPGKYRTLVIDPPWDYGGINFATRSRPGYAEMSLEEITALPVPDWADDEFCHLYLWTTNNFLGEAFKLIEAWGFNYKTCLVWAKPHFGLGTYFRSQHELCLFATTGQQTTRANNISTVFEAPAGEHSAKPDEFYDIVRRASYPPYGEGFQREAREDFADTFTSGTVSARAPQHLRIAP